MFNFDQERNVPTLYSSFAIIICSILLSFISLTHKKKGNPWIAWAGLAIIFLFLSIDETASIHERFTTPARVLFDTSGLLYYAWVIPYGVAVSIFILFYSRFLIKLPTKVMFLFLVSGLIFILGAIGFELLGGRHAELYGEENILYSIYYTCEETLEMLGIATFIYTLLFYINSEFSSLTLTIKK